MGSGASSRVSHTHVNTRKFAYSDVHLMTHYLPSFIYYDKSTEEHRRIAAQHWEKVFKDTPPQRNVATTDINNTYKEAKHITKAQSNKITELYDIFYAYLEEHGGDLKHVFRSSMHVRGRVLVHISAGMRTMLASENIADKVLALTKTHRRFGVKLEHFDCVGRALLHAMERSSGENWSSEIEDAWRRIFSHASVILIHAQKKSEKQATKDSKRAARDKIGPSSNTVINKTPLNKMMTSLCRISQGKSSAKCASETDKHAVSIVQSTQFN